MSWSNFGAKIRKQISGSELVDIILLRHKFFHRSITKLPAAIILMLSLVLAINSYADKKLSTLALKERHGILNRNYHLDVSACKKIDRSSKKDQMNAGK